METITKNAFDVHTKALQVDPFTGQLGIRRNAPLQQLGLDLLLFRFELYQLIFIGVLALAVVHLLETKGTEGIAVFAADLLNEGNEFLQGNDGVHEVAFGISKELASTAGENGGAAVFAKSVVGAQEFLLLVAMCEFSITIETTNQHQHLNE